MNATCPNGHEVTFSDPDSSFVQVVATDGGPGGTVTEGTIEHHVVVVKCNALKTPNAPDATDAQIRANAELCGVTFEVPLTSQGAASLASPDPTVRHTIAATREASAPSAGS